MCRRENEKDKERKWQNRISGVSSEIVETIANIAELLQNPKRERRNLKNVILVFAAAITATAVGDGAGDAVHRVSENKKMKRKIKDN